MYFVEDSHEAIIDQKTFDRVQQELERRAEKYYYPSATHTPYLLTGLIRCGLCGRRYRRRIVHAKSKYEKAVWICPTFDNCGKTVCSSQLIPEAILIAKTTEVLGDISWEREMLIQQIKEIRVPGRNVLVYLFQNGRIEEVCRQSPSRRESWPKEKKQKAREHELNRLKQKRKEKDGNLRAGTKRN